MQLFHEAATLLETLDDIAEGDYNSEAADTLLQETMVTRIKCATTETWLSSLENYSPPDRE